MKIREPIIAKAATAADWVERKLFAGQRKNDRSKTEEPAPPKLVSVADRQFQNVAAAVASIGLILCFVYGVYFYSNTLREIERNPLVVNLAKAKVLTSLKFGRVEACPNAAPDCWSDAEFDDSSWEHIAWPTAELHDVPGYPRGISDGRVNYRIKVVPTPEQIAAGDELAFSPLFISHGNFSIYVNGRLVQTGTSVSSASATVVISVPKSDLAKGYAVIGIQATMDRTDKGVRHLNGIYFGPKVVVDDAYVFRERALGTYFLLFLTTKGAIFVVFCLFFFFSIDRRALRHFLLYAFCVTVENGLSGNFLANFIELAPRLTTFYLLKVTSTACLLAFFVEFFQAARARRKARWWNGAMFLLVGAMAVDCSYGSRTVNGTMLYQVTNLLLTVTLIFGVVLGLLAIRLWTKMKVEARKIAALKSFVAVLGIYLALISWEFAFNHFVGFDKRAVFDLLFFVFVAFITAKEFGFNAGQVVTLEAHMLEKRRMELELQEAAEIAKAFLPGALPNWQFAQLGVFHRALSESSGDWYTFEDSASGRFCHFILCDITGHGVQAALVASTCRTVLSALKLDNAAITERSDFLVSYAKALNHILYSQGGGHHVSTILGLSFDREDGKLHYLSGGHPNPMIISMQPNGQRAVKPLISRHSVLGTGPTIDHAVSSIDLKVDDEVLAFSDGLPIGSNLKTLKRMITAADYQMETAAKTLYDEVWREELEKRGKRPDDDVSVLWLKRVA